MGWVSLEVLSQFLRMLTEPANLEHDYAASSSCGTPQKPVCGRMTKPKQSRVFKGHRYAKVIRRDRPAASDKWHLDEVVIIICGKKYWLWRAIDSKSNVLDILVQSRCNTKAADRIFRKLFKQYGYPCALFTDKLGSYGAALGQLAPSIDHRAHSVNARLY